MAQDNGSNPFGGSFLSDLGALMGGGVPMGSGPAAPSEPPTPPTPPSGPAGGDFQSRLRALEDQVNAK